uniref:Uncharacterized protein n=1 Tax=Ditylenchus dipsaci TaxID=166011 RepID=A0A915ER84_9BILA
MLSLVFPSNRPPMMRRGIAPNQPRKFFDTASEYASESTAGLPPNHFQRPQNINEPVQQPRRSRRVQQKNNERSK